MNGGEISNNTSKDYGGGVSIQGGKFTMTGGVISGNTANNGNSSFSGGTGYGGGVYLNGYPSFAKTGGTIYGYTQNDPNSNTVVEKTVILTNRGHAIYVGGSSSTHKETTIGEDDDLYYNDLDKGTLGWW
ncbi:MAG: hypothetical protein LBB98_09165 [Treponema sp.]|jgi:hypothetical protein|nr:hypothetical protein [Treponema sp.]